MIQHLKRHGLCYCQVYIQYYSYVIATVGSNMLHYPTRPLAVSSFLFGDDLNKEVEEPVNKVTKAQQ